MKSRIFIFSNKSLLNVIYDSKFTKVLSSKPNYIYIIMNS